MQELTKRQLGKLTVLCTCAKPCVRMEEVARRYRGGCMQEQEQGGGWKELCGTES